MQSSLIPGSRTQQVIFDSAQKIGAYSTALSNKIVELENWLANLPGKVPVRVQAPSPNAKGDFLNIDLSKRVAWSLYYAYGNPPSTRELDWDRLIEAPISIKLASVDLLDIFITRLIAEHTVYQNQLVDANDKLTSIGNSIGLTFKNPS